MPLSLLAETLSCVFRRQRVRVWRPAIFSMCEELEDGAPAEAAGAAH